MGVLLVWDYCTKQRRYWGEKGVVNMRLLGLLHIAKEILGERGVVNMGLLHIAKEILGEKGVVIMR